MYLLVSSDAQYKLPDTFLNLDCSQTTKGHNRFDI